uniref:Structural maintenance of chromosomes protein 4 n=1 Tax=Octactis speculum TaxID=3111310 RepID=A0A7S2GR65_9STRA
MNRDFAVPRGAQRLFDLVQPNEPRYRCVFFYALRNTLVTSNLDVATSIAYQGNRALHRVVTLDGQLIDTSGTMSGGGKSVRRGGMSAVAIPAAGGVTQQEVSALEEVVQKLEEELASLRSETRGLEQEQRDLRAKLTKLRKLLPKLEMTIEGAEANVIDLEKRKSDLRASGHCELSEEDMAKISGLEDEMEGLNGKIKVVAEHLKKLEAETDKLQKKIMDAGGEPVKKQRKKRDACSKVAEAASLAVDEAMMNVKQAEMNAKKAAAAAEKASKELEKIAKATEGKKEKLKELEDKALDVQNVYDAASKVAKEKHGIVTSLVKEQEALKSTLEKIMSVEVDINNQLEEYNAVLKENKVKAEHWMKEVEKLQKDHTSDIKEWGLLSLADNDDSDEEDEQSNDNDMDQSPGNEKVSSHPSSETVLPRFDPDQLKRYDREEIKHEIMLLEEERESMAAKVNMSAVDEWRKKDADYQSRFKDLDGVTNQRDEAREAYEELRRKRLEEFMAGFGEITMKLKEMYQMITLGGDAELELVDSLDPFSEGIVFSVRPPKKSWKNISNLSGGEKTLSSLALIFALHHYKPNPLYVMDEIDAALDFKNVSIVANYIKERTKNAQFVIISLRNNMFELADRLVGIYKTNNTTKSVTINPRQFSLESNAQLPQPTRPLSDCTNVSGDMLASRQ